jgi:DNA uptake protein ComE-like DNA-binding protein
LNFMRKLTILCSVLLGAVFTQGVALPYQAASPAAGVQQESSTPAKSKKSQRTRNNSGTAADPSAAASGSKGSGKQTSPLGPKADLNSASQAELEALPGVGASTAKKIIAGRPYSSVGDLSKAGVPARTITKITPLVTVGSTPSGAAPTAASQPLANQKMSSTRAASNASAAPQAGGGPGMVWVNPETKVFHRQGDKWYGKTKNGKYMTEADAVKGGYHESKQKTASK